MGNVSRSSGRSSVQAVCYIARAEFHEERRGITADYSNIKDHEVFWETLGPEGSGIARDDLSIWNKVEKAEDEILTRRYKDPEIREQKVNEAVPAYSDHLALPKELSKEQNIELAREFIQKRYIDKGLIATYSIHWEETVIRKIITEDETTKDKTMVHAWSLADILTYLTALRQA